MLQLREESYAGELFILFSLHILLKLVEYGSQKFSTHKRPIGGMYPDETLTRFPWFSLSGLEQFSSSMSALQQMHRGDTQSEQ